MTRPLRSHRLIGDGTFTYCGRRVNGRLPIDALPTCRRCRYGVEGQESAPRKEVRPTFRYPPFKRSHLASLHQGRHTPATACGLRNTQGRDPHSVVSASDPAFKFITCPNCRKTARFQKLTFN